MILVTGGAGFIGANFVLDWLAAGDEPVLNVDKLTYAGNLKSLESLQGDARHIFVQADIGDGQTLARLLAEHRPRAVVNFAAESHVDRSIHGPEDFIQTNVVGTFRLLEAVRGHWSALDAEAKAAFRFLHVSTDEVYGSLAPQAPAFTEDHTYEPNSPYSASKAASDHLVRAWHHTYGLPVLTTNCSNNYGPLSREADTADDRQRPGRQAPAHLWRRHAGARLALRARPLQRHPPRAGGRRTGRDLQRGRLERKAQCGDREHRLRPARRTASQGRWHELRHADHLCEGPSRP
jgi:nucleoside-diphosphate-sugar epimerase